MLYLFQVTIYSALLYSVYIQVLKNRASHNWNRIYLLLCAILPLIVPFITIPELSARNPVSNSVLNILLPEITVFTKNNPDLSSFFNWSYITMTIYLLVTAAIVLRTITQYINFKRFAKQCRYEVVNNIKVLLDTKTGPGSFQNYIFLPGDKIDSVIFEHELAHIKLKHSSDILLLRLLRAIFWPNIVLYFIGRELKTVHEFQADAYAVQNKEAYITTLLNETFNTNRFVLSHTFFYHPLKRRIMMLQKTPLSRTKLRITMLKTGFSAVVLLSGIIYLQSCKQQQDNTKQSTPVQKIVVSDMIKGPNDTVTIVHGQKVYPYVDKMPEATYDLSKYISANIKYPEAARKNKIAGRVIVKFIIDENGNVTDPIIVQSIDPDLDAEALRVISAMPKWIPGIKDGKKVPVYLNLPISFQMN